MNMLHIGEDDSHANIFVCQLIKNMVSESESEWFTGDTPN